MYQQKGEKWVCVKRRQGCRGAAVVQETVREVNQHNHPPVPCDIEVLRCRNELKRRALTSNDPPARILADVLNHISHEAKVKMGNLSNLKRFIQRSRMEFIDGKMIYNGYIYNRQGKMCERNRWICVKRWQGCRGTAMVYETAREIIQHNHPPEACDIEVLRCRSELKRRASTSSEPPAPILADVLNHISDEAKVKMGNESSLKRFIQRSRRPYLLAPVKRTIVNKERRIGANYIRRSIAVQVDLTEEVGKVDQMTQTRPRYDPVATKVVYKFVTDEEAEMDEIDECFPLLKQ
ncbi:unnamed protein product [Anisakis simplex]|uniref:FLYWCH-type domain-containing protein n=1 Tax=Anisakis simplex TaxID=6269 RepID=A0A0M3JXT2_ANISI|nr:unnamed protein product [Anisakis simplex]